MASIPGAEERNTHPLMSRQTVSSDWVSLREAAEILGVHPATIRNWADRGDLPARRTPGGHRRFRRADLLQWLETRQAPPPAEIQMLIQSALGRARLHISEGSMQAMAWYAGMDDAARQSMAQRGRAMLEALQGYLVDSADVEDRDASVRRLGEEYARFLIGQGLTFSEAMEGFTIFSDFLHEATLNIVEVITARPPTEWLALLRQVRGFTNALLLGIAQVYDRVQPSGEGR